MLFNIITISQIDILSTINSLNNITSLFSFLASALDRHRDGLGGDGPAQPDGRGLRVLL